MTLADFFHQYWWLIFPVFGMGMGFYSALDRRVRMGALTLADAQAAVRSFDTWAASAAECVANMAQDFAVCDSYMRRFDLPLRHGLHIAIASRLRASISSFDKQTAASAKKLGVPVVRI